MTLRVAGVDGYRGGWIVAVWSEAEPIALRPVHTFAEVLTLDVSAIGVDIPIGALETGEREADRAARRFVGPRRSSVFPTPPRCVHASETYADALSRSRATIGKGISKQAFFLCSRIVEVETAALADERVFEVHPEVSFREMAGGEIEHPKRRAEGIRERRELLQALGIDPPSVARVPMDDVLDSCPAAWTAARYARGEAQPLPEGWSARIGAIWR